jgi:hypothetical protein
MIGARASLAKVFMCSAGLMGSVGGCTKDIAPEAPPEVAAKCEPARPVQSSAPSASLAQRVGGTAQQVVEACRAADPLDRDPAIDASVRGHWQGEYAYDDGRAATRIEAEFRVVDGTLAGEMDEPNTLGVLGFSRLASSLAGDVYASRQIVLMKTYTSGDATHSLLYTGTLAESGDRIEGRWRIGAASGPFWLQRG